MRTKKVILGSFLAGLLMGNITPGAEQGVSTPSTTRRSVEGPAAPVIHRRAALPSGWFHQGTPPTAITSTKANEVQPVVHYDTLGTAGGKGDRSGRPGVAQRMRQVRQSTVFRDGNATALPTGSPQVTSPPASAPVQMNASPLVTNPSPSISITPPPAASTNPVGEGVTAGNPVAGSSRRSQGLTAAPSNVAPPISTSMPLAPITSTPAITTNSLPIHSAPAANVPATLPSATANAAAADTTVPSTNDATTTQNASPEIVASEASPTENGEAAHELPSVMQRVPAETTATAETSRDEPLVSQADPQPPTTQSSKPSATARVEAETGPIAAPTTQEADACVEDESVLPRADKEADRLVEDESTNVIAPSDAPQVDTSSVTNDAGDDLQAANGRDDASITPSGSDAQEKTDDDVLSQDEAPLLSVVTRGPKTLVVGKTATYIIHLRNRSASAAKDVVVRMNIPAWVEVVQQSPTIGTARLQPEDSGQSTMAWNVGGLRGNADEKLVLDIVPRGSRPVDLGVTWTFAPASSVTQIQVQEPKLQMTVVGPQDVLFGETKVYVMTISNPGSGDAENVVLSLLPLVPGEKPAGVRPLGTISAGGRRTVEVELTARQTGRLQVRAEVSADGGLLARGEQEVLVRRAALEVQVQGPPKKYAGTRSRYEIQVANTGDATAADVEVVANLPAGAQQVACSDGGTLQPQHGQVQWSLGELRAGASRVLELECSLASAGDNRLDVRTTATGDLSALASATTRVEALADLKLTVNDPQGAVAIGSDVTYEVRVVNRGTKAAENIEVFGYFSEGVEPISVQGWRGSVAEGEVTLQTIPRLGPGQEMMVRITAQASRGGDHVFRAELECGNPETKLAVEEWTRFYGDDEQAAELQAQRPRGHESDDEENEAASPPRGRR